MLAREELHQLLLDFDRILGRGPAKPPAEAADVGIHDDASGGVEGVAEDDVGGFTSRAGDGDELVDRLRDLAMETLHEGGRHADQILGFVAEEACRSNKLFDVALIGVR